MFNLKKFRESKYPVQKPQYCSIPESFAGKKQTQSTIKSFWNVVMPEYNWVEQFDYK